MSKKLIRIERHPLCSGGAYNNCIDTNLYMAMLSTVQRIDANGYDIRQRATSYTSCREVLMNGLRALTDPTNKKIETMSSNQNLKEFDFEKLRLLLATKIAGDADFKKYKQRLFAGKRALNLLEAYAGWDSKSIISTVISTETSDKTERYWMVTGPKEWASIPQLLSLCILILRMSIFCCESKDIGELNTESVESMLEHMKEISKTPHMQPSNTTRGFRFRADVEYFLEACNYILPILKNYKKLFYKDLKDNWSPYNFRGYGGITTYIKCSTGDDTLSSKFRSIVLNKK